MLARHNQVDQVRETGDAAWRVVVSAEQIRQTEDTDLIDALESQVGLW